MAKDQESPDEKLDPLIDELKALVLRLNEVAGIDACCIVTMRLVRDENGVSLASNALTVGSVPPPVVGAALLQVATDHMSGKAEAVKEEIPTRPKGTTLQ